MLFRSRKRPFIFRNFKRRLYSTIRLIKREDLPSTAYQPKIVEINKYEKWENGELYKAGTSIDQPVFSMVLPPPNVTGKLHLGHALTCSIQDVIVRRKRSVGYNVLWLPGIDHAGIATQGVVEKYLKTKYNIDRREMTSDTFKEEVFKWKDEYGDTICQQLRILGTSLDWSRQTFTMDPKHTRAVETAFTQLYDKGLIYRKEALVNWCHALQSTVSDIEVENVIVDKPTDFRLPDYEKPVKFGVMFDFAYKVHDSDEDLVVSTTMPETMLGDVAVAVNSNDKRYNHLRGKRLLHPFRDTTIPIIYDDFVDMKLGTGAVKITPAHSKVDYEVALRHNLPLLQVINENRLIQNADGFNNLNRYECRDVILKRLNDLGLLRGTTRHGMTLPVCSRTGDVIEYLPKEQWFLSCSKLNKRASDVVRNGELKIEPQKFVKNWLNWTEDDRDWCISRQLWWGHQIPAYRCTSDNDVIWVTGPDEKSARSQAANRLQTSPDNIAIVRDSDVLDTWFSSAIYPFSSLGWPDSKRDYEMFYPLNLMTTGHDILGFWVHRMVILGLELTGKLPFNNVLLHGIICDNKGAKMSKSKGNVIDPIDVINGITMDELNAKSKEMHTNGVLSKDEYDKAKSHHKSNFTRTNGIPECGVDALRLTLLSQDIKSHYINFDLDLCHANKLFCNKIWQSVKYIQLSLEKLYEINEEVTTNDLTYFDKWILSRLANMVQITNKSLDDYDLHVAVKAIRSLIYNEYCDIYLESTKPGFDSINSKIGYVHAHTLIAVLNVALRCLAPFMIYVTDEVIPKIPAFETNIIHNFNDLQNKYFDFPMDKEFNRWRNLQFEQQVDNFLNTVFLVRQIKGFYGIPSKPNAKICIKTNEKVLTVDIDENISIFQHLAKCGNVVFDNQIGSKNFVSGVLNKDTIVSVEVISDNVEGIIQSAKSRLKKKVDKTEETISKLEAKFCSDKYLESVTEQTQNLDREKILHKREELKQLQRLLVL